MTCTISLDAAVSAGKVEAIIIAAIGKISSNDKLQLAIEWQLEKNFWQFELEQFWK